MYFWRDKKLAHDLHKGFVSEKQQMVYLLIGCLFYALFMAFIGLVQIPVEITFFDYINQIVMLVGTILPVLIAFKINQSGDKKDFIARYICLGLPIGIKSSFITLLPFIIDPFLFPSSAESYLDDTIKIDFEHAAKVAFVSGIITYVYVIWRYTVSFKIASGQEEYGE